MLCGLCLKMRTSAALLNLYVFSVSRKKDDASDDDKSKTKPIASLEWNPS